MSLEPATDPTPTSGAVKKPAAKKAAAQVPAAKKTSPKATSPKATSPKQAPAKKVTSRAAPAPAKKATKPAATESAPKAVKVKAKLVRDSFTMPRADFALIDALKERALAFKRPAKKSELLRAGLHALSSLSNPQLKAALDALTPLKPGRPKQGD